MTWRTTRDYLCALLGCAALFFTGGCGGGGSNGAVGQPQVVVEVFPSNATAPVGTLQPFTASVTGAASRAVTWTASAGTIGATGNYTAPASVPHGGTATVTATSMSNHSAYSSAIVTITTTPVTLGVSPQNSTVKAGFSQIYTATVGGTTNTSVNWSVNDVLGDTTFPGTIVNGNYTAPAPVVTTDTYSVTATSNADPTKTASASVTVTPLENQEQQAFPIKLGASGVNANADCCSGTLGSLLADENGRQYILSNNHILGRVGHASVGEAIVQPGYIDTFCNFALPNTVAHFTAAPPIEAANVDAAIAQVVSGAVDSHGEIIGFGGIASDGSYIPAPPATTTVNASVGMAVSKSGRTTGVSCGNVTAVNGMIRIDLAADCGNPTAITVLFDNQIVMGNIANYGDSGSLIVETATARPVGMVAGIATIGPETIITANPAGDILSALNASTGNTFSFVGGEQHSISCPTSPDSEMDTSRQRMGSSRAQTSELLPANEISRATLAEHKYAQTIMQDPAVLGLAVSRSETDPQRASILVFVEVSKRLPLLPKALDGFPVRVVTSGRFTAGTNSRPIRPRCSPSTIQPTDFVLRWRPEISRWPTP
ncbi:exported hypothetical protein [Candidatus Sulfotelmatobacter sp. SbA7]|nr:exported hypothetical protein [Candidatus Sulfotelmatobacter sp. SbA7]